ncbi:unnamed protein product [marine sediment metagenome]|uniref:Uncharacterized protein n=1 Tax=marine sediment metagenome TaxID=412755 RepID=X1BUK3_9ZZZZ
MSDSEHEAMRRQAEAERLKENSELAKNPPTKQQWQRLEKINKRFRELEKLLKRKKTKEGVENYIY